MKKGGFIKRNTEKAKAWLSKRGPIKKRNAKRAKAAFVDAYGPPGFGEFVRSTGCVVANQSGSTAECLGPIQFCHLRSRGAGGGWRDNAFGACMIHHGEQHGRGIETFQRLYGLDLDLECCAITHRWDLVELGL